MGTRGGPGTTMCTSYGESQGEAFRHEAQLFGKRGELDRALFRYVEEGLGTGEAVLVMAPSERLEAFRSLAEQKRSVGFPKTDETSVSSELDDHLAHLADGACRGAHWLWEGDGQEVRIESGDFHTRLSYGRRPLLNTPGAPHPGR